MAWTCLVAAILAVSPGRAGAEERHGGHPDRPGETGTLASPRAVREPRGMHREGAFDGWPAMAGLAAVLAVCGGIAVAARRLGPRCGSGAVQVVGRVGLSPKHSVYLLRVGRRVLVVGAGPQGPPALIAELDDVPPDPPASPQGAES